MKTLTQRPARLTPAEKKKAYTQVAERSQGICEACGVARAEAIHHRLYRSRGGIETVENLLHVCGRSNVDKCHGKAHGLLGEQLGWSVRSRKDPATIPVFRLSDGIWRLNGQPIPASDATELMVLVGQLRTGLR